MFECNFHIKKSYINLCLFIININYKSHDIMIISIKHQIHYV